MTGDPQKAGRYFKKDPATIRRWISDGCPTLRPGGRGPGQAALLDFEQVAKWRGKVECPKGNPTQSVERTLNTIASALLAALDEDKADLRAGCPPDDAAAVLLVAWERLCQVFTVTYRFDEQPEPIRALMRIIYDASNTEVDT